MENQRYSYEKETGKLPTNEYFGSMYTPEYVEWLEAKLADSVPFEVLLNEINELIDAVDPSHPICHGLQMARAVIKQNRPLANK